MAENRVMPPGALTEWREKMGLSTRAACQVLGLSRGALRNFETNGAPLYIAYACAAIHAQINPYKTKRILPH